MEDIKRYIIEGVYSLIESDEIETTYLKYSDHTAVVESKDKMISNYLKNLKEDNEKFKELYSIIEAMQNIERVFYCSECDNFYKGHLKPNSYMECDCGEHAKELSAVDLLKVNLTMQKKIDELEKSVRDIFKSNRR